MLQIRREQWTSLSNHQRCLHWKSQLLSKTNPVQPVAWTTSAITTAASRATRATEAINRQVTGDCRTTPTIGTAAWTRWTSSRSSWETLTRVFQTATCLDIRNPHSQAKTWKGECSTWTSTTPVSLIPPLSRETGTNTGTGHIPWKTNWKEKNLSLRSSSLKDIAAKVTAWKRNSFLLPSIPTHRTTIQARSWTPDCTITVTNWKTSRTVETRESHQVRMTFYPFFIPVILNLSIHNQITNQQN